MMVMMTGVLVPAVGVGREAKPVTMLMLNNIAT